MITGGAGVVYGARYVKIKTLLSGGGTEYATLGSAFTITDPTNAHTITTVSPANAIQGQTLNVALTATGTDFVQGVTYANFGDGVTINTLTIDPSGLSAMANVTVSNTTPVGYRTITLVTGGEFAKSGSTAFYIGPNSAALTGLTLYSIATSSCTATPVVEPQGWSGEVCLTAYWNPLPAKRDAGLVHGRHPYGQCASDQLDDGDCECCDSGWRDDWPAERNGFHGWRDCFAERSIDGDRSDAVPGFGDAELGAAGHIADGGDYRQQLHEFRCADKFRRPLTAISPRQRSIGFRQTQVSIPITISNNANVGSITANLIVGPAGSTTLYPFTFTVTPSNAAITSVTPSCVPQGGQVTLTVGAINTNWVQGTTTASFYPVPVPTPEL